jgi:hypothetical protein
LHGKEIVNLRLAHLAKAARLSLSCEADHRTLPNDFAWFNGEIARLNE